MEDKEELIKILKTRWQQLKDNRAKFEDNWTEAQKYADNVVINWGKPGEVPEQPKRFTSKPYQYNKTLVAGILGYAVSPSLVWFKLGMENTELLKEYGVKDWLEQCESELLAMFNRSNFYKETNPAVKNSTCIGHGVLHIEEDIENKRIRYTHFPANEIFLDVNSYGEVDTCFRWYADTLRNIADFFGEENLSEEMQSQLKEESHWNDSHEILMCVYPRENYNPEYKDAKNMPYACIYLELGSSHILKESGYREFPFAVFYWDRYSGFAYGASPAMDAMPDIKALNIIKKSSLQIAQTSAEPPMMASQEMHDIDLSPRGITYLPTKDSRLEPVRTGENYPITLQELANYEQAVKDWFYVDYFLALQERNQQMTATEVMELQGEKAATLSTFIVSLNDFLSTIIQRTFNLLMRAQMLPPPPMALMKQQAIIKIDFTGPLAQNQKKYHQMGGTVQALAAIGPIMQMFPNAGDFLDGDELMKSTMGGMGMPQNIIREDDDVKKIREERIKAEQQQAAQQQQMAMAQTLMQNANKMGEAPQKGSIMEQLNEKLAGGMNGI
jgi:hypothetical protein